MLTLLSNIFTNLNLTDMETCYKVFRREIIQGITLEEDRFGFEPEVTAKIAALRGLPNLRSRDLVCRADVCEGKKIGWRDGVRAVWCIWKYRGGGAKVRSGARIEMRPRASAPDLQTRPAAEE